MKNTELIKKILEIEFPKDNYSDKEIEFLERYKIGNETEVSILKSKDFLGKSFTKVEDYYKNNKHVEDAKKLLQKRRNTYNTRKKKDPEAYTDFAGFLKWWYSMVDEKGNRKCYYCGIDEETSKNAFAAAKEYKISLLPTDKVAWKKGSMQIDRKNPKGKYNNSNSVFACVLCNNAKSDMITDADFIEYFRNPMQKYWEQIKKEMESI